MLHQRTPVVYQDGEGTISYPAPDDWAMEYVEGEFPCLENSKYEQLVWELFAKYLGPSSTDEKESYIGFPEEGHLVMALHQLIELSFAELRRLADEGKAVEHVVVKTSA